MTCQALTDAFQSNIMRFDNNSQQQIKRHDKMRETVMKRSNQNSFASEAKFRQDDRVNEEVTGQRTEA